ncbi:hypothetical protein PMAYCL1PPCAC_01070, partial [Pristionchus mayeri]
MTMEDSNIENIMSIKAGSSCTGNYLPSIFVRVLRMVQSILLTKDLRCLTYKCAGKAKMINGKLTIYNDHKPVHLPPDHGDEIRNVRKKAQDDRKIGISTADVIKSNVINAPPHLKPHLNAPAIIRSVQRSVEVRGIKVWPATLDASKFDITFLREDNCHLFRKGDAGAHKILLSDAGLRLLRTVPDWSADGTFFAAPHDFAQI